MNELKFQLTTFALVALLAFGGYWAFTTLDRGVSYTQSDTVVSIESGETTPVVEPVVVSDTEEEGTSETSDEESATEPTTESEETTSNSGEYSEEEEFLLEKLQGLIDDNIFMRQGSQGTRVGTVQQFLNLYLDEETGVDNQYGPGTLRRVREFQEAEGLSADGLAGPATYQKMIEAIENGEV